MKTMITSIALGAILALTSCSSAPSNAQTEEQSQDNIVASTEAAADENSVDNAATTDPVIEYNADIPISSKPSAPIVIDFNAPWCGPCREFGPIFHQVAAKYADKMTFISVNVDNNQELAQRFGVQSIPLVVIINTDGSITRSVGLIPASKLESLLNKAK